MQVAANLLRQSRAPVLSVALDVGYESEAAFTRAFKRLVGTPPATWRRTQNRELEQRNSQADITPVEIDEQGKGVGGN